MESGCLCLCWALPENLPKSPPCSSWPEWISERETINLIFLNPMKPNATAMICLNDFHFVESFACWNYSWWVIFSIVTARNVYGGEVAQLGTTSPPADFPKLSSLVKLFKPPPTIPPQHIRSHKHCFIFCIWPSNNLPSVQALNAILQWLQIYIF